MTQVEHPRLEITRLVLRQLTAADAPHIVTLAGDRAVASNTSNIPHPYHPADARWWVELSAAAYQAGEGVTFAIELKSTGDFIGAISLTVQRRFDRAEAGYWLGVPYWNQGLMSEALAAVLRFGFAELGLNKILATHFRHNLGSVAVMQKNGMVKEAELVQHVKRDGHYHDLIQYRLTRHEYAG
ncbi:GNAT family N-acetyltransferase [Hymenobacter terrenus]|uniref:GNAT family N-acetyltransferase n=1 Tax=Hymenobacter terrenus TaxID=1629124 RepID=UPI000619D59F|nr:GNAT family N-acetyltransferase [Hymenobacter terrenus]